MTAYASVAATVGQPLPDGVQLTITSPGDADAALTTFNTSLTTAQSATATANTDVAAMAGTPTTNVAAAVATLVADGALPTQAHVTALNTAWGVLSGDITTSAAAVSTAHTDVAALSTAPVSAALTGGDAVLFFNAANVLTVSNLKRIFNRFIALANGGLGGLTP